MNSLKLISQADTMVGIIMSVNVLEVADQPINTNIEVYDEVGI